MYPFSCQLDNDLVFMMAHGLLVGLAMHPLGLLMRLLCLPNSLLMGLLMHPLGLLVRPLCYIHRVIWVEWAVDICRVIHIASPTVVGVVHLGLLVRPLRYIHWVVWVE